MSTQVTEAIIREHDAEVLQALRALAKLRGFLRAHPRVEISGADHSPLDGAIEYLTGLSGTVGRPPQ